MTGIRQQIDAVRRQVGARMTESGETRVVTLRRVYDATVDEVWDACTNEHWQQFGPGAVGIGWDTGLLGLARHLSHGPATGDAPDAAAWLASGEGREFIRLSNQGWRDAYIESGTSEAVASAAAERTLAAYTGSPG